MPFAVCRSCHKLIQGDVLPQDGLCRDCSGRSGSTDVVVTPSAPFASPAAPIVHQLHGQAGPQPVPDGGWSLSPWFVAALVLLFGAVGLIALNAEKLKAGASWLTGVALVMIFGAIVMALAGVASRGDREARRQLTGPQSVYSKEITDGSELSHRWAWQVFRATGALFFLCVMLVAGLGLPNGLPFYAFGWIVLAIAVGCIIVGLFVYAVAVFPRIGYFFLAGVFGKRRPIALAAKEPAGPPPIVPQTDLPNDPPTSIHKGDSHP
jgi:hypothetical protein